MNEQIDWICVGWDEWNSLCFLPFVFLGEVFFGFVRPLDFAEAFIDYLYGGPPIYLHLAREVDRHLGGDARVSTPPSWFWRVIS